MRKNLFLLVAGVFAAVQGCGKAPTNQSSDMAAYARTEKVMFDLGNVLVKFNEDGQLFYNQGAYEHLIELIDAGYEVGLITNIPETFGENCGDKFQQLKDFIDSKWADERPFDWSLFTTIVLPPRDTLRKPHKFPFMQGLANSCNQKVMFVAEEASESNAAANLGMASHLVSDNEYFLSLTRVREKMASEFEFTYPSDCDFQELFEKIAPNADQNEGCVIEN